MKHVDWVIYLFTWPWSRDISFYIQIPIRMSWKSRPLYIIKVLYHCH